MKIFTLLYATVVGGCIICGIPTFLPSFLTPLFPIFYMFGFIIAFFGVFIVYTRSKRSGAIYLLNFPNPAFIIWLYIWKDGILKFCISHRTKPGTLSCDEVDGEIAESESYKLGDHTIRVVGEGIGGVSLQSCDYASQLTREGFDSITEVRNDVIEKLQQHFKEDKS